MIVPLPDRIHLIRGGCHLNAYEILKNQVILFYIGVGTDKCMLSL